MNIRLFLAILISLPLVFAAPYNQYDHMEIDLSMGTQAVFSPKTADWRIDHMTAELFFFPRNTSDGIITEFTTTPDHRRNGSSMVFEWEDVKSDSVSINAHAVIENSFHWPKVKEETLFPILRVPPEMRRFVMPEEKIDSNDLAILTLASSLAEGE
ncbi:MAG: hypothetical protein ABIH34_03870, partial [Nanoarchaeota archaeon]